MSRMVWLVPLLVSAGCASNTGPSASSDGWPWHNLRIEGNVALGAEADLAGDTVRVHLLFHNQGSTPAQVEFGVCAFAVRGIGRHGAEWDNHPAANVACADFGLQLDLAPGQTRDISVYRNTATRIRELVPKDRYQISIFIREGGTLRQLPAGSLDL